jgi:hypothetical protein
MPDLRIMLANSSETLPVIAFTYCCFLFHQNLYQSTISRMLAEL